MKSRAIIVIVGRVVFIYNRTSEVYTAYTHYVLLYFCDIMILSMNALPPDMLLV